MAETPFLQMKPFASAKSGSSGTPVYIISSLHSQAGTGFPFVVVSPSPPIVAGT
jgi:hypothetical protein